MNKPSRYVVFITLYTATRQLAGLTRAAEAFARSDPPIRYTVASFARRRNGQPDRRVMIAFERCPSSDAIIRTYRHIANTVSGDAAVQTTVHFSDGSEVDLHEGPAGADVLA